MALTDDLCIFSPGEAKVTFFPIPGMYLDGTGDYASTPDDNTLDITGDIDYSVALLMPDWTTAGNHVVVAAKANTTGNQHSYAFMIQGLGGAGAGTPFFFYSTNGTTWTSTAGATALTTPDGTPTLLKYTFKLNDGAGNNVLKVYTRPFYATTYMDDLALPISSWTLLSTKTTVGTVASINASTATMRIGSSQQSGSFAEFSGAIYGSVLKNGIDGTVVANPDFGAQVDATSAFTDVAGRTWSMNGDAYMTPRILDGWLACDGASLDTTTYANLFQAIRYKHGGSGSNFNIPDVMKTKRFLQGGFNPGATGGATSLVSGAPSAVTAALAGGGGPTPGTATHTHTITDGRPPWMDVAVWIKT